MVSDCGGTYWMHGRPPHYPSRNARCKNCETPIYADQEYCGECVLKMLLTSGEHSMFEEHRKTMDWFEALLKVITKKEAVRRGMGGAIAGGTGVVLLKRK